MDFKCPNCSDLFINIPEKFDGVKIKCTKCGHSFIAVDDRHDSIDVPANTESQYNETIFKHSCFNSFILLFIPGFLFFFLLVYYTDGSAGIKKLFSYSLGFYVVVLLLILGWVYLFASRRANNSKININTQGISAINGYKYSLVEANWPEIDSIKIRNLFLTKIIVIKLKDSGKKLWFEYESFSSSNFVDTIRHYHPEMKIE